MPTHAKIIQNHPRFIPVPATSCNQNHPKSTKLIKIEQGPTRHIAAKRLPLEAEKAEEVDH